MTGLRRDLSAVVARITGCSSRESAKSRLAQLVERKTLNLVVVGSSPTVGARYLFLFLYFFLSRGTTRGP